MKYINFNIIKIKNKYKKSYKTKIKYKRVRYENFSVFVNLFNFLNGTDLKIRTIKRDWVGMRLSRCHP